ncbi:EAL domain-containing protein [Bacillus sp. BGMRC 2118]|nr:EAL domain-containing protein [Bacillus sp. BGMRC 2118]
MDGSQIRRDRVMVLPFYIFNFLEIIVTIILSSITTLTALTASKKIKKIYETKHKLKTVVLYSILLGFFFWATNLFVVESVGLPYAKEKFISYFSLNFILCCVGSFVALWISQDKKYSQTGYIFSSVSIGLVILGADLVGFFTLYHEIIKIQPLLLFLSTILVFSTSFSMLRFLIQVTNEELFNVEKHWLYVGVFLTGIALAGIPYILLVSTINIESVFAVKTGQLFYLLPFIYMAIANVVLMICPDLFGEKVLFKLISQYKSLSNHNPNAVFSIDLDGRILDVNQEASHLTGYSVEELKNKPVFKLLRQDRNTELEMILKAVKSGDTKNIETKAVKKDGSLIDVRITAVRIIVDKEIVGVYGIVEDITSSKQALETIEHLAYVNELTGLPNRRKAMEKLAELLQAEVPFSILLIDFDRFKRINDNFGHTFGDYFLSEVANKLKRILPEETIVSRLGGDEFLVISQNMEITKEAEKIVSAFRSSLPVNGVDILATASIGISSYPMHSNKIDELLKYADIAMYNSKDNGADTFSTFSSSMLDEKVNILLENDLRSAIKDNELEIYYQPKYDIRFNQLIGSEALLRWKHPIDGFISPNVFVPLAEEVGLIVELERYVIKYVISTLAKWKEEGLELNRVSINTSFISIFQEDFVDYIVEQLNQHGIDGSLIELEITERIVMKNEEYVNRTLLKLKELGIEISMDDFGTGYSSLSFLHKLQIDRLKIDKSFIDTIQVNSSMVSTIIAMAKNLNLKVIAEGVETTEQVELLKKLECFEVQGYYYSPPINKDDYEVLLKQEGIQKVD